MFNIGPGELMAIAAVALIVLGPQRLPQALRSVGRVIGELRRISGGFQDELRRAIDDSEIEPEVEDVTEGRPVGRPIPPVSGHADDANARQSDIDDDDEPETMLLPADTPESQSLAVHDDEADGGDERAVS